MSEINRRTMAEIKAKKLERMARAAALRGRGLTFREVGEVMGFSTSRARYLCTRHEGEKNE